MNQADVIAKLQAIFDTVFLEPVVLTPAISAKDVPEWDSLTHISLMVAVEKAFNVRFRVGSGEHKKCRRIRGPDCEANAGTVMRPAFSSTRQAGAFVLLLLALLLAPALVGKKFLPSREAVYSSIWWKN